MLYVRMEIWPFGDKEKSRVIGEATISNTGGTKETGEYEYKLYKYGGDAKPWPYGCKVGHIHKFPRLDLGAWDLMKRVLLAALKDPT